VDVMASWVVPAAHRSAFRAGRRDPSHLSVQRGELRLHRPNAAPDDLFSLADVSSGGWAHPYEGPLAWGEPYPLGVVWFVTKDELFVFPLADWWSNGVECSPRDAMRSSGFLDLFETHGVHPLFAVQPGGRFAERAGDARIIRSVDIDAHRRLATAQLALSLGAAVSYVVILALAVTSFLLAPGELSPALIPTGAAVVVLATSIANLWSISPWLRLVHESSDERSYVAPKSSKAPASDRLVLTPGSHGLTASDASSTSAVIRGVDDTARPGTMRFQHTETGDGRHLVLMDERGLPRACLPLADWAPTAPDERRLEEWLHDQGIGVSTERLGDAPLPPPIGVELARVRARQALLGGGPWRTPSPLSALRPCIASGVLLVPFVITLSDGGRIAAAIQLSSIALWVLSTGLAMGLPAWWVLRLWMRLPFALRREER
jgi:hypothetical protein